MKLTKAIEGYEIARISEGYSHSTIASYRSRLRLLAQYLGDPQVDNITLQDLQKFLHYLRTDYTPQRPGGDPSPLAGASLYSTWKAIRSFWNWAADDLGVDLVAAGLPAPEYASKEAVPFTEDEIRLLLKACEYTAPADTDRRSTYVQARPTAARDRALVLLLLDTGLRASECTRLRIEHVDLETGGVEVIPFGSGRKTSGRQVFLGSIARRALWRYLADREYRERDPLICTTNGGFMNNHTIRKIVVNLGRRAGVKNVYPHRFRHTFAIQYLRNGGDIFTLQRLLGHRSLEMVKRYLAIAQSDVEQAHRQASPADRWHL